MSANVCLSSDDIFTKEEIDDLLEKMFTKEELDRLLKKPNLDIKK